MGVYWFAGTNSQRPRSHSSRPSGSNSERQSWSWYRPPWHGSMRINAPEMVFRSPSPELDRLEMNVDWLKVFIQTEDLVVGLLKPDQYYLCSS